MWGTISNVPTNAVRRRAGLWWLLGMVVVLLVVAAAYWQVLHAQFIWDDVLDFQQRGWIHHGDAWMHFIFKGFNDWTRYFRPLGVGLFVLQVRLFGGTPLSMHAVTLGLQLANVVLVMLTARALAPRGWRLATPVALFAGLAFGIHPMLVGTVTWIGCQFDQAQVLFALLGILASVHVVKVWPRAVLVAACFFLSACAKESAALFPAIIVVIDWLIRSDGDARPLSRLRRLVAANWPVYALLLAAGVGYLVLRHVMMGALVAGVHAGNFPPIWADIDRIAWTYLKYWAVIFGLASNVSPIHPIAAFTFGTHPALLAMHVLVMLAILAVGLLVFGKKLAWTGAFVIIASLYLFPVLGIIPVHLRSVYHERYAIGAVAMGAVLLPGMLYEWARLLHRFRRLFWLAPLLAVLWAGWGVLNVRTTVPLWSNGVTLWSWALRVYPGNSFARGNLVGAESAAHHYRRVRVLVDQALAHNLDCPYCYLNGFMMAVHNGNARLVHATLGRVRDSRAIGRDREFTYKYWRTVGFLQLRQGKPRGALHTLDVAIKLEPREAFAYVLRAEARMKLGRRTAAAHDAREAIRLVAPRDKPGARSAVAKILAGRSVYSVPMP